MLLIQYTNQFSEWGMRILNWIKNHFLANNFLAFWCEIIFDILLKQDKKSASLELPKEREVKREREHVQHIEIKLLSGENLAERQTRMSTNYHKDCSYGFGKIS